MRVTPLHQGTPSCGIDAGVDSVAVGYGFPNADNKCGTCLLLTCNNQDALFGTTDYCNIGPDGKPASLIVTIDNTCPECGDGSWIDIFEPAFLKVCMPACRATHACSPQLASGTVGYVNVDWQFVPCPGAAGLGAANGAVAAASSGGGILVRAEAWEAGGYRRLRITCVCV